MNDQWYYLEAGEQRGPVSVAELRELAAGGKLAPEDLIWKAGMPQWLQASAARGIFPETLQERTSTGAAPGRPAVIAPTQRPMSSTVAAPQRPATRKRMSGLAIIALIFCLLTCVTLLSIAGVGFLLNTNSKPLPADIVFNFPIAANGKHIREIQFQRHSIVTINVVSEQQTDIDVLVFDPDNNLVASDTRPDANCFVNFQALCTGIYRIEFQNLDFMNNHCHVTIQQHRR